MPHAEFPEEAMVKFPVGFTDRRLVWFFWGGRWLFWGGSGIWFEASVFDWRIFMEKHGGANGDDVWWWDFSLFLL